MNTKTIAIDGPSGAGKSSISKMIAKRMGNDYIYIDTGAMYRVVALAALRNESAPINDLLSDINISFKHEGDTQSVFLNNENVSELIRTPEISRKSSETAKIPQVRIKLIELQQKMAKKANVIMDGRDIATNVLPNADVKIFLTASPEERAKRRFVEMLNAGHNVDYENIYNDMKQRDTDDIERKINPLRKADDAKIVDTTGMSFEESVDTVYKIILKELGN